MTSDRLQWPFEAKGPSLRTDKTRYWRSVDHSVGTSSVEGIEAHTPHTHTHTHSLSLDIISGAFPMVTFTHPWILGVPVTAFS